MQKIKQGRILLHGTVCYYYVGLNKPPVNVFCSTSHS